MITRPGSVITDVIPLKIFVKIALSEFQRWFRTPFNLEVRNVAETIEMLAAHPFAGDTFISDHPSFQRFDSREFDGYQIFSDNQGIWGYYVRDGDEIALNPPVYFSSSVDLSPFQGPEIDTFVVACNEFSHFIWHSIATNICFREQLGDSLIRGVSGIVFDSTMRLDDSYRTLPSRTLPTGIGCFYNGDAICDPQHGYAAFLNEETKERFVDQYRPDVRLTWG